jgi:hypothetical protein
LFLHNYESSNKNVYSVIYTADQIFTSNQTAAYSSHSQTFVIATAIPVPEINAGSLSQALLILFALWLVVRPRETLAQAQ